MTRGEEVKSSRLHLQMDCYLRPLDRLERNEQVSVRLAELRGKSRQARRKNSLGRRLESLNYADGLRSLPSADYWVLSNLISASTLPPSEVEESPLVWYQHPGLELLA